MSGGLFQGPARHRNAMSKSGKFLEMKNVRLPQLCKDLTKEGLELAIAYMSEKLYLGKKNNAHF